MHSVFIYTYISNTIEENYKKLLGPNAFLQKKKYIFVYQDVRGRYMSEGTFTNMTPQVAKKTKKGLSR